MIDENKNKPIVEMDDLERQRTWDSLGKSLDEGMLSDARNNVEQTMQTVAVVLTLPSGEKRVVYSTSEYGDNEGISCAGDVIRGMLRLKLLREGESLERVLFGMRLEDVTLVPLPLPEPGSAKKKARRR